MALASRSFLIISHFFLSLKRKPVNSLTQLCFCLAILYANKDIFIIDMKGGAKCVGCGNTFRNLSNHLSRNPFCSRIVQASRSLLPESPVTPIATNNADASSTSRNETADAPDIDSKRKRISEFDDNPILDEKSSASGSDRSELLSPSTELQHDGGALLSSEDSLMFDPVDDDDSTACLSYHIDPSLMQDSLSGSPVKETSIVTTTELLHATVTDNSQVLNFTEAEIFMMKIYDFLEKIDSPRRSFDVLRKVLLENRVVPVHLDFTTRKTFVKRMKQRFPNIPKYKLVTALREVVVPKSSRKISNAAARQDRIKSKQQKRAGVPPTRKTDVVLEEYSVPTWDFREQLLDLLSNEDLLGNLENLNVDHTDPFARYHIPTSAHSGRNDVQDWLAYQVAYDNYIHDGESEFLLPIILYLDKTGTDVNERYPLEPVCFRPVALTTPHLLAPQ